MQRALTLQNNLDTPSQWTGKTTFTKDYRGSTMKVIDDWQEFVERHRLGDAFE